MSVSERNGEAGWRRWVVDALLALVVLLNGAYFYNGANWNQIARYDMIFAYVEPGTVDTGTFAITHFVPDPAAGVNTGDWARNPALGTTAYYSNKAPGPSLAGIPIYMLMHRIEVAAGIDPTGRVPTLWNCYILNLLLTVLPLALAAVLFRRLLLGLSPATPRWAAAVTLGTFAGTLLFPYSTQFWGHGTAAACVVLALWAYRRGGERMAALSGLAGGAGVLSEYSCAFVVVGLGAAIAWPRDWRLALANGAAGVRAALQSVDHRRVLAYALGGLPMLMLYGVYHSIAFGSWWAPANFFNNDAFRDAELAGGLFGAISGEAVWGLTFSRYRGLFSHMPILILVLPTLALLVPRRTRLWAIVAWGCILSFLAFNLTFNGWHGGACVGPRYQTPVLPLYGLLIYLGGVRLLVLLRRRPARRALTIVVTTVAGLLLLISIANMAVISAQSPMYKISEPNPLGLYYRAIRMNAFRPHVMPPIRLTDEPQLDRMLATFNLGEFMGLHGRRALAPWLVGLLALAGSALWLAAPRRRRVVSPEAAS